ncbi:MAG: hypothetical protein OWT28_05235 [Firmicutes bacterium]|nr:hypothetical protein [Bacillota bacterium]
MQIPAVYTLRRSIRQSLYWLARDNGDTVEVNTNKGAWWAATIIAFLVIGGSAWWVFGNLINEGQTGATNIMTSLSSQQGLNTMAQNAEKTLSGFTTGSGGTAFQAPTNAFTAP